MSYQESFDRGYEKGLKKGFSDGFKIGYLKVIKRIESFKNKMIKECENQDDLKIFIKLNDIVDAMKNNINKYNSK